MKKFSLFLKNKKASMLVSSLVIASIIFLSLTSVLLIHAHKIKFLQLEKNNRIGKILIHKAWQDIELEISNKISVDFLNKAENMNKEEVLNNNYSVVNKVIDFNKGSVNINSVDKLIYVTARLDNGIFITQSYINPYEIYKNKILEEIKNKFVD